MLSRIRNAALCASAVLLAPALGLAADFDGSKALICATMEAHDCSIGEACQRGLPQDVGAPLFMRIDFAKKTIAGPKRTTPIVSMSKNDSDLLLQGSELGYAWTIVLNIASGSMSASMIKGDTVFALFGACTPQ